MISGTGFEKDWHEFVKCLVTFTSEAIGSFPRGEVSHSVRLLTRDCSARTFFLKRRGEVVSKLPVAFRLSGCWACRPSLAPLSDPVRKASVVRSPFLRCHFVALSPRFLGYSS